LASKLKVPGFRASATKAGLRSSGDSRPDLALVMCDSMAQAAGVFTRNKVRAAPGILAEKRLRKGTARAVLVNAGIANSMTGEKGMEAATDTTAEVAKVLQIPDTEVLPASTGVIGVQLPVQKINRAAPRLVKALAPDGFGEVSEAILTTDTGPKVVRTTFKVGARKATLLGLAKGAGMIAPNMATMLAFLFTDVDAESKLLRKVLRNSTGRTFNRITVDGDTSTNDTVLIMAGGSLGNRPLTDSSRGAKVFAKAVEDVCARLAEMIVRDGEGATRIARVVVKGASSDSDAHKAARAIAESLLVKTALHGADPNWGRIAAAVGRSGAKVDQKKLSIKIGPVTCVVKGVPVEHFDEKKAAAAMKKNTVLIEVNLGLGRAEARYLTSDLTAEYVRINAHYRT